MLFRRPKLGNSGNVAIITALCMPLIIGGAGLGVEVGYDHYEQVKLQQAADAAAFAGGVELRRGSTLSVVTSTATAVAQQNGSASSTDTVTILSPAPAGPGTVKATLARNEARIFSGFFVNTPLIITVNATAQISSAANACILALDPTASGAATFSGNSTTTLSNCVVMANSISSSAVNVQGSAQLYTPCIYAVGGVSVTSGAHMTSCSAPQTGQGPVGDPFGTLTMPADTGPCLNGNSTNLSPGRYCNGLSFKNTAHLSPGVYILSGGTLQANANANVSGDGVTIFLLNDASVSFNGSATFNLSAPTTGPYSGFLFVGGRNNSAIGNVFNGNASSSMTGNIYFPAQPVDYRGNFTGTNGCTHIVAKTVQWTGNTTVGVDCSTFGMGTVPVGAVTLIG